MFGTIPSPIVALDQTPNDPNPLQLLRLMEALYYGSKQWLDSEATFPATFDQLHESQAERYHTLARYLLARRSRPGARPVPVAEFEARLFETLDEVLRNHPYHLVEGNEVREVKIEKWLGDHYALSPERTAALAERWAEQTRNRLPGGKLADMPY